MNVIRAKTLGYCMGVRRAVELAETALSNAPNKNVFSLGPLIHNKTVLDSFAERGLAIIKDNEIENKSGVIVIRAHGVPPETENRIENAGLGIVDATCPLVKRSQKIALENKNKGLTVVLAGDKNHGEVVGIAGYAGDKFVLVQNEAEAVALPKCAEDAVLLAQTTFSLSEFKKIENILLGKFKSLKVINTICPATQERQDALEELAPKVDGMIVIGGKNSANTQRLFTRAQKMCAHAAIIETADEIPAEFFKLKTVGLAAGASTPDSVIVGVENRLKLV